MKSLKAIVRLTIFVIVVTVYILWSYICHLAIFNKDKRLAQFSRNTRAYSKFLLKVFNLKLIVKNLPPESQHCMVVSNHMGFVDILMLASTYPTIFVTSNEMRETPFLGLLTEMAGCIYVERRSRTKILEELKHIASYLKKGFRVTLYPEAQSTNGEQVLPFKKTLLMAASEAGVPIQPVVINFREVNGISGFPMQYRDCLCWYGDLPFVKSLWGAATLGSVVGEIRFLDLVTVSQEDDRTVLAERLHAMVSENFNPPQ